MDKKIFEVEISSGGPESYKTSAVLTMPCTQAELCDALQKARVQDVKTCRNELTRIRYPGAAGCGIRCGRRHWRMPALQTEA